MESSKMFGGAEECHSSESGWTMYIGSPIRDDDDDGSSTYAGDDGAGDDDSDANDDDDSMASDASSGPSHEMARLKHRDDDDDDDDDGKSCMKEETQKSTDKELEGKNKKSPKKEDKGDMTGSSKVRKSLWQSKRK
ncbi:hypothetical protein SLA2020_481990 [Shorea laevis]